MDTVSRIALFVARIALTAWVGAAILFVIVGVAEVTSPDFSSEVKDQLAVLRFPLFYSAGFLLLTVAWCCVTLAPLPGGFGRARRWAISGLLLLSLVAMAADYQWIYLPLARLITPPGQVRTSQFMTLHRSSARVNAANLGLCLVAVGLLNWPRPTSRP